MMSLVVFLDKLESYPQFPSRHLEILNHVYGIDKTDNAEIKLRFYKVALKGSARYAGSAAGAYAIRYTDS
jgi:leukotriene-A4 hydrolase